MRRRWLLGVPGIALTLSAWATKWVVDSWRIHSILEQAKKRLDARSPAEARRLLADAAARAATPLGAGFTFLALTTGSLWGRPTWGTWWVWDARLTSVLVLFLFYLG